MLKRRHTCILSVLCLPQELRPALFALRAFNVEVATVADVVRSKEAILGQLRFQWWRDAVRSAFDNKPPSHPVALALAHIMNNAGPQQPSRTDAAASSSAAAGSPKAGRSGSPFASPSGSAAGDCETPSCSSASARSSLESAGGVSSSTAAPSSRFSRYSFKRLVDVREQDFLDPQPPLELSGLESYAEGTASQLLYLQVGCRARKDIRIFAGSGRTEMLVAARAKLRPPCARKSLSQLSAAGIKNSDADHAASHLGRAVGIATLLRGSPAHAAMRRSYLPVDLCAAARVSQVR